MANDLAIELGAVAPDVTAAPASEKTRGGFAESERAGPPAAQRRC